jgi:hypothetical protein
MKTKRLSGLSVIHKLDKKSYVSHFRPYLVYKGKKEHLSLSSIPRNALGQTLFLHILCFALENSTGPLAPTLLFRRFLQS